MLAGDLGVAYVVTVHGADVNVNLRRPGPVRDRTRSARSTAPPRSWPSAAAVARRLGGVVACERLHTVPNGVTGLEQVAPSELLPDRPLVLSVGNLYASKGHATVLAALARLEPRRRDVAYVVVGDGPEEGRLKARARELGLTDQVTFLGWRPHDEVLALMARADAFVLPSAPEGFGLVYAEAMAQGTPVVACRGEGPDDFVDDGVSGLLVPPDDAAAVARAITRLLDDPTAAARMAQAGRAAVSALTWRRNAEHQLEIYERVAAAQPVASGTTRP